MGAGRVRFGEPMGRGKDMRTRGRAQIAGFAVLAACTALAAPAAASAAETSAQVSGPTLRVTGLAERATTTHSSLNSKLLERPSIVP